MTHCTLLDLAQEGRLDNEQRVLFDAHLINCVTCRESMALWKEFQQHLGMYLVERSPDPSDPAKARLLEAVAVPSSTKPIYWGVSAAVVAAAAVVMFVLFGNPPAGDVAKDEIPAPSVAAFDYQLVYPTSQRAAKSLEAGAWLRGDAGGHVIRFRNSVLGIDRSTEVGVIVSNKKENQFRLKSGIVAVELPLVEQRETLVVKAGFLTVAVTGTMFWVEIVGTDQVEVGVLRGEVFVAGEDEETWTVKAGARLVVRGDDYRETLEISDSEKRRARLLLDPDLAFDNSDDAVDESSQGVAPDDDRPVNNVARMNIPDGPGLERIEQWILQKQYAKAKSALQRKLKINSSDRAALNLLATCYRKQGKYNRAAEIYGKLTAMGSAAAMNRARYKLSVIYQENIGDHATAVEILKTYLTAAPKARPNTIEARMRLASSLRRLGRSAEYRRTLEAIVSAHPGTRSAQKAKQLLAETP